MSPRFRLALFLLGAAGLAALLVVGFVGMPHFGTAFHPYRDRAVAAAIGHVTANTVGSVTFDVRGTDTLGEEIILFASVLGASVLLRPQADETRDKAGSRGRAEDAPEQAATVVVGWLLLPVAMLVGLYLLAHGHVSPGGGFQGGVTMATALHLLYLAGSYPALERIRPQPLFELTEAAGALGYAVLGASVLLTGAAFLDNVLAGGTLASLVSGGTVPVLNFAVGVEVGSAFVLLIAQFLEQALVIRREQEEGQHQ